MIVKLRGRSTENHKVAKKPISDIHKHLVTSDLNQNYEEEAATNPTTRNLKKGSSDRTTQACYGATNRTGFIDKVQQKAMIDDGTKLADDVLALPVWAAAPSIRFKTIGVQLTQKRRTRTPSINGYANKYSRHLRSTLGRSVKGIGSQGYYTGTSSSLRD